MVSLCSLIRLIGMCADRDQPEFLCSRSDSRCLEVDVATAGGCQRLLTHYHRREVRKSIYRYWKIHIDYRSKFSYRFRSSISIIYSNTKKLTFIDDFLVFSCHLYSFRLFRFCLISCLNKHCKRFLILIYLTNHQSGTEPNLVAKIWPPNLVTIYAWLPKLVANVSSNFHHLAVGSSFK